jgi:down-regulator of transcription 1
MSNNVPSRLALPKSALASVIAESLPAGIACSADSVDVISEACLEFIQLMGTETAEVCDKAERKLMKPQDVITALNVRYVLCLLNS